jgi:hypothetical protein
MANLILLKGKSDSLNLNEMDFKSEEEIEKTIFETKNILPEVLPLKRQLQTYDKDSRIDIVGVDNENNILVIEIKKGIVDESVIEQVLKYSVWVETHPDAIKSIWLEQKNKPEDFVFDWNKDFNLKVLIIGRSFKPSVQRLINRITYPVELIEFKKFTDGASDYIFLNKLIVEDEKGKRTFSGIRDYDEKFYTKNYNPHSATEFWKLCNRIEGYIKQKKWNLSRNNNKGYVSFKYGFPIVFGVQFIGSKSFGLFFKIPKGTANDIKIKGYEMLRYEDQWNQAVYKIESGDIDLNAFEPLFIASYKNIVGEI